MINMNLSRSPDVFFQKALLTIDMTSASLWDITGQTGYMSVEVQKACTGPVYVVL